MPDLAELARRRGLYVPANEAYGGVAGLYTYGPVGTAIKRNVEDAWRERFVTREGHHEVESPTILPEPVLEASGHLDSFDDPLVACPDCDARHRADHLVEAAADLPEAESLRPVQLEELIATHDVRCPDCAARLAGQEVSEFTLAFETSIGPDGDRPAYLRPETAQGTLVEFPRLATWNREQLPMGVAQVGRAYRNEISPRNAIVRLRELTLAELQLVYDPERDDPPIERVGDVPLRLCPVECQDASETVEPLETTVEAAVEDGVVASEWLAYYLGVVREWLQRVGVDPDRLRFREHDQNERAHYATECWDPEAEVDGEWIELAGVADRGAYDLAHHADATGEEYDVFREYDEPRTTEETVVDVDRSELGPRFGDRTPEVVAALEALAERDPAAIADAEESIAVAIGDDAGDDETVEIAAENVSVRREERTEHGERIRPQVVEPSIGIDRVVYAVLAHRLGADVVDDEARTRLALPPEVAPQVAAVCPLRDDLADRARDLADRLRRRGLSVTVETSGSIGRRYRRQDEVGTPYCVTVDERTPEEATVTVRDRDSTDQVRVAVADLPAILAALRAGDRTFEDL